MFRIGREQFFQFGMALCFAWFVFDSQGMGQHRFLVEFRNGTRVDIELADPSIAWREVAEDGRVTEGRLDLSQVQEIELAQSPASQQAMRVTRLVKQLQAREFATRSQAEKALIEEARPFLGILKRAANNPNPEVRYRVKRILKRIKGMSGQSVAEYDEVITNSGKRLFGDCGGLTLNASFRERSFKINRLNVGKLTRITDSSQTKGQPWENRYFREPEKRFYQKNQRNIDFDIGPNQKSYEKSEEVNAAFAKWGCLLNAKCDAPAKVVITTFKITAGVSSQHSAATYVKETRTKYRGELHIRFCMPVIRTFRPVSTASDSLPALWIAPEKLFWKPSTRRGTSLRSRKPRRGWDLSVSNRNALLHPYAFAPTRRWIVPMGNWMMTSRLTTSVSPSRRKFCSMECLGLIRFS